MTLMRRPLKDMRDYWKRNGRALCGCRKRSDIQHRRASKRLIVLQIMDQESKITSMQAELDSATPTSLSKRNQDPISWLPSAPARHTFQSHKEDVTCVAFHPIFSTLASGSLDCTIKIWDWELGESDRTIKAHTKGVLDVDFGGPKGGVLLASCSNDLTIKLWDPNDEYKHTRTFYGHDHSVSAVRFVSPAMPNLLVSASRDKSLRIWDISTGQCVRTIEQHSDRVRTVSTSLDGEHLLSGGNDKVAMISDTSSGTLKAVLLGHENYIECCAFAPPTSYEHIATMAGLKKAPPASSVAEYVATGARDDTIKIWNVRGTLIKTLVGHDTWVRGLAFHPGGRYLLSVSDDKTLRCWDLSQGAKLVRTMEGAHGHFINCIRWAPTIYNESAPATTGETEATNGTVLTKRPATNYKIQCVIATGSVDHMVRVFV